ncbi:unnamed protein product [Lactuca saligna]|uniref:Protein kinase domain-containing protein n=1 Tax=Lactuca saligna TaxID=75948 RepID=A0AA35Z2T3_LACSI|nr:unnamed protein product [Lactuca saligna]
MGGCFSSNQEANDAKQLPTNWEKGSYPHHPSILISDEFKFGDNLDHKGITFTKDGETAHGVVQFTFRELATATKNFCIESFMGEDDFGCVYKGRLERSGQVVSVQHRHRICDQGIIEFFKEVMKLSLFHHANLVNLIGYCTYGDHLLLVHKFVPLGSLKDHLHDLLPDQKPLDWNTRMKIAVGVAKGLEYLHKTSNPSVVYRDLKPSNILLDEGYQPKLSNFKLGKHTPFDNLTSCPSFRVDGTYTHCAPEGPIIFDSDVYSFGLIFLELITGRKVIDYTRPYEEQCLVYWARPLLKDRKKYAEMADPLLEGRYPPKRLKEALVVAAMCIQEGIAARPDISSVVAALTYIASSTYDPNA